MDKRTAADTAKQIALGLASAGEERNKIIKEEVAKDIGQRLQQRILIGITLLSVLVVGIGLIVGYCIQRILNTEGLLAIQQSYQEQANNTEHLIREALDDRNDVRKELLLPPINAVTIDKELDEYKPENLYLMGQIASTLTPAELLVSPGVYISDARMQGCNIVITLSDDTTDTLYLSCTEGLEGSPGVPSKTLHRVVAIVVSPSCVGTVIHSDAKVTHVLLPCP